MRQRALVDFGTSLDRIRALANSIASATGAALKDAAIRELHETQECGAVVLLTGYFETFLKDLVRQYIGELSASGVAFAGLPEKMRLQHFEGGGKVLSKAVEFARKKKPAPFGGATPQDIVARLHSASNASGTYQIVWEAFADTQANPGPDVVNEIAKGLGLEDFWRKVSKHSGDQARWSDSALKVQLGNLIGMRNACAHTGTVSPIPSAGEILEFADMLQAIGNGFVTALEEELQSQKARLVAGGVAPTSGRGSASTTSP